MSFPNATDIATTTLEKRSGKIQNNVVKNNGLLAYLNERGNIRTVSGGRVIYEELSFAQNGNGGWYSGFDPLPTSPADVITAAEYGWKQYAVPVVMSGLEELQNSGEEAKIDLLKARLSVAEDTMSNDMAVGCYSDGTGTGGKQLAGLDLLVPVDPTTGTAGNINRANYPFWRSYVSTGTVLTSSNIQGQMNLVWSNIVRGADRPTVIIADALTWQAYIGSLQVLQRFAQADKGRLGFATVQYMDCDVILDGGIGGAATAKTMYFLNTKYLYLRPHKDRNMVPLTPSRRFSVNQDAAIAILAWAGAMTASGLQFHGRLIGS